MLDRMATLMRPATAAPVAVPPGAVPAGTTAAQAAAASLPLLAVAPSQAPLDARGALLAVNDRAGVQRADAMAAGGHTVEGPGRRRLRRGGNVLGGRMPDLLHGARAGAAGRAGDGSAEMERLIADTMQWLFWLLAIVAYACLGLSIVAFLPVGSEILGTQARSWTGGFALGGLAVAAAAWLLARRLGRRSA